MVKLNKLLMLIGSQKIAISSYPVKLGNLDTNSFVSVTYTASLCVKVTAQYVCMGNAFVACAKMKRRIKFRLKFLKKG